MFILPLMKRTQLFEEILMGLLVVLLAAITLSAILFTPYTQYIAYTFFITWGIQLLYYMVSLRNYFSLIILGLTAGAGGVYMATIGNPNADTALLLGKISLGIFTALFAFRLYKARESIQGNDMLYLILIVLLVFQIAVQDVKTIDALSLAGFVNYFTVGIIAHILFNGFLHQPLKKGEKMVLLTEVVFSLYNISLMLISKFA